MGRHCARRTCPFCGWHYSDRKQRMNGRGRQRWFVQCCSCGGRGPEADTREDADKGWDGRAPRLDRHGESAQVLKLVRP